MPVDTDVIRAKIKELEALLEEKPRTVWETDFYRWDGEALTVRAIYRVSRHNDAFKLLVRSLKRGDGYRNGCDKFAIAELLQEMAK